MLNSTTSIKLSINIMPPKKDAAGAEGNELLIGFTDKETKLLAAAFLSSTGPDKVHMLQFISSIVLTYHSLTMT